MALSTESTGGFGRLGVVGGLTILVAGVGLIELAPSLPLPWAAADVAVSVARAGENYEAPDADEDGLPDELEVILGTSPLLFDTDGDDGGDGLEFVNRSDPLNALSKASSMPGIRVFPIEDDDVLRIFVVFFPGNLHLVELFELYLGSPQIDDTGEGDDALGILNFTSALPSLVTAYSTSSQALNVMSFQFELDAVTLDTYAPLSLGFAARVAGSPIVDQVTLDFVGSTGMFVLPDLAPNEDPLLATNYLALPLDPAGGGFDDPQYCETGLSGGEPTGAGGMAFSVVSADCVPDGLLYCLEEDCKDLVGETFIMIDYGFLQTKSNE